MRKPTKIVSLATALAALGSQPATLPAADASEPDDVDRGLQARPGNDIETEIRLMSDGELMRFTVHRFSDGLMFPQHGSHSSHSSHVSHASSSGGGGGGYWPSPSYPSINVPPIYPPAAPPPVASPPVEQPPAAPPPEGTTTPPPAATDEIRAVACGRARNGFGANDISSELQQRFGLSADDGASVAQQALTAVFGGGHYCDGY